MAHEPQMTHINNHALCSLDIEVAGGDPRRSDIVEICIILLDNFIKPSNKVPPFYMQLAPFREDAIDLQEATVGKEKLLECARHGLEPSLAADRLEEWHKLLDLPRNKGIIPLCYNWPRIRDYLITWLGWITYKQIFAPQYRDIMMACTFVNDHRNHHIKIARYPRPDSLAYIAHNCDLELHQSEDVMVKTLKQAEIYQAMMRTVI